MGVLACDRKGCENIMCDRLSRHHGYICNDCFKELTEHLSTQPDKGMLFTAVEDFMNTPKQGMDYKPYRDFVESYLNEEFSFT